MAEAHKPWSSPDDWRLIEVKAEGLDGPERSVQGISAEGFVQ
jgi:hypothetical protein